MGSYNSYDDIVIGDGNRRGLNDLYFFDTETKSWEMLPSMIRNHDVEFLRLVYSDGFIYVIDQESNSGERFCITENKWERLPEAPVDRRETYFSVPIAYEGKLLVYSVSCRSFADTGTHKILEYTPTTNAWQSILTEEVEHFESAHVVPALVEAGGNIYRVMYKRADREEVSTSDYYLRHTPVVHVLELQSLRNGIRVSAGEEVNQDWIPINRIGAFRIQDDVFINARGFVQMTDIKIKVDQNSDVDLQAWESFARKWDEYISTDLLVNSNIMYFTFDKNKFGDR